MSDLAPIVKASEIDPAYAAWVEIEKELLHDGYTRAEVDTFMAYAQEHGFREETARLLAEGKSAEEVEAMWLGVLEELPKDDPNSTDPDPDRDA